MASRTIVRSGISCLLAGCLASAAVPLAAQAAPGDDPTSEPDADVDAGEGATAAILPLAIEGDIPESDVATLTDKLVDGLERGAFGVVRPADVEAASAGSSKCADAACAKKIAKAVDATHVVRAKVKRQDRDYTVEVTLLDGSSGKSMATTDESCEICGVTEAGALIETAAATLKNKLDALAQGPSTLGVTSTPGEAEIRIDGELLGTTPFSGPVIPGKHVLRISKEGFITIEREVTFVEGVEENLAFELDKVPSRLPPRPYGFAAIGVGIAGLAAATTFAVLDDRDLKIGGNCRQGPPDAEGNCPKLWDVDYIVLGSAIGGAALVTLGIAILLNSAKRRGKAPKAAATASVPTRTRRPRVGIGAGRFTVSGHF